MKHLPNIIGALLGLAFLFFGLNYFFKFVAIGGGGSSSPVAPLFFKAIAKSGFLDFVKVIEIVGAILVAFPKTRNFGLLALGPIVVGIIAVNIYIKGGNAVFAPPVIAIGVMSAYLLWEARAKFAKLLN